MRTDAVCANLERLRGFRFATPPEHPISEKRSDLPDSLVQHQLEQERIQRIGCQASPAFRMFSMILPIRPVRPKGVIM